MNKIKTLSEKVINQIAAGEVVERPASVVKELVENALDAHATWVEVEVAEGGSRLIRVMDNGEGMPPDDAQLAVRKHATSKISTTEDLSRLHSFGFRGEALSSIASVSQFELLTRTSDALSGVSIKVKGGGTVKVTEAGRASGTTVSVSNLFFNTPARLKFMKKQSTEENHIVMVVSTYALAFPDVGFKLTLNGKEVLQVSPTGFTQRLSQVLGKEISSSLQPVDFWGGDVHVLGAVSSPTVTKPTRENMIYFVNRRWVMNPSLGHAVMTAYHTLLPTRRFPAAILFIEVPVDQVDVNVHPTKREVKFQKDREIYDMIVRAIRDTLLSTGTAAPPQESAATPPLVNVAYSSLRSTPSFLNEPPLTAGTRADSLWTTDQSPSSAASYSTVPISGHGSGLENMGFGNGILQADRIDPSLQLYNFSQLFNTFIVFQSDSEMYIADQHTVHERLNYERLMKGVLEKKLEVQPLLVPITVELSAKEAQVLRNNLEVLLELGMEMAPFGGNTFLVRSVSADLADRNVLSLVKDLVDDLAAQENSGIKTTNRADMARERAATFMSCRSAMMAGDRLNEEQMRSLIDQMRQANLPFTCPHGRPTILSIPLSELYRRFDRH